MIGNRKLVSAVAAAAVIALAAVLIVRFVLLVPSPAEASFTTLSVVSGTAEVRENDAKDFRPAVDGETLNVGDTVRTGPDARAVITFFEGSTVEMEPQTELTMEKLEGQEEGGFLTRIRQSAGVTWHRVVDFVDPRSRYEVNTPAAAVAVRGTLFQVQVEPDGTTTVATFKGRVAVSAGGVEKMVEEGMRTRVVPGEPVQEISPLSSPLGTLEFELGSAAVLLVVTPLSTAAGLVPPNYPINQEPGTSTSAPADEPETVMFRRVFQGTYEAFLFGTATGSYHLNIVARSNGQVACQRLLQGTMNGGERWVVSIDVEEEADHIVNCSIGEPHLTTREPEMAVVLRDSLLARLPLRPAAMAAAPSPAPLSSPTPTPAPAGSQTAPADLAPAPVGEVLGTVREPSPGPSTPSPAAAPSTATSTSASPTAVSTKAPAPTSAASPAAINTPTPASAQVLTPTPASAEPTGTPTPTRTATATNTSVPTPTATSPPIPTNTPTPMPIDTSTSAPTATSTPIPTNTPTPTPPATSTPIPTNTPTPTPTDTPTPTPTSTSTPTPTKTPTNTPTSTPTTAEPTPTCVPWVGDKDVTGQELSLCDERVTSADVAAETLVLLLGSQDPRYDVNHDGKVDWTDLRIVADQPGTRR